MAVFHFSAGKTGRDARPIPVAPIPMAVRRRTPAENRSSPVPARFGTKTGE